MGSLLTDWEVDYGDGNGEHAARVPHAWRQEAPVEFEGPVRYSRSVEVPRSGAWLLFHAVSYFTRVLVEGVEVAQHEGMWDAFSVSLDKYKGKTVRLEVEVVKASGPSFPVNRTATGLLPYLHYSFGGIWGAVELFDGSGDPLSFLPGPAPSRIEVSDRTVLLDGEPFFMRGLEHQGWYPNLGHCLPSDDTIRGEIRSAQALGFNTIKFALWMPPHRYLELMAEASLVAWLQLPIYRPSAETNWDRLSQEIERIVRQYRRHGNIAAWSLGAELESHVPVTFRERSIRLIRGLTGCPLVGDNSIDSDSRELGTFSDHAVSAGLPLYQPLLSLLGPASVRSRPTFLGQFSEVQAHRDIARLLEDHPFWASSLPEFNARGVRQDDSLAGVLRKSRFAHEPRASDHEGLLQSSSSMASFVRRRAIEDARSMPGLSGYVLSNWRDTPVSTSGLFDDWGQARVVGNDFICCNGSAALLLIPSAINSREGGHVRMSFRDRYNVWSGANLWHIAVHSEKALRTGGLWRLMQGQSVVAEGTIEQRSIPALQATEVGTAFAELNEEGCYELRAEFGEVTASWDIHVTSRSDTKSPSLAVVDLAQLGSPDYQAEAAEFGVSLTDLVPDTGTFIYFITSPGVFGAFEAVTAPFWEQATYQFAPGLPFANKWSRIKPIHSRLVLKPADTSDSEVLMRRIDTSTYEESALLVRLKNGSLLATLWPWGGLEGQAIGLRQNPAGVQLLRDLLSLLPCGE